MSFTDLLSLFFSPLHGLKDLDNLCQAQIGWLVE